MNKVIVAGGRDFNNYPLLHKRLNYYLSSLKDIEIVSGGANGADKLGEKYAEEKGLPVKRFPADWDNKGKAAGYLRNKQMAEYATHCICFWDGASKGTGHMIELAKQYKLILRIVKYK